MPEQGKDQGLIDNDPVYYFAMYGPTSKPA